MDATTLRYLLQQPIAFHRALADVAGGATGGLFLSQLLYWSDKGRDPDGWIYKTQAEWQAETALTRSEQERARKALRDLGVLEEARRDVPARLYYRLDFARLASLLDPAIKVGGKQRASPQDPAGLTAASREHSSPEITSENTQAIDDPEFVRRIALRYRIDTATARVLARQCHDEAGHLRRAAFEEVAFKNRDVTARRR